jgi:hypothetical protein
MSKSTTTQQAVLTPEQKQAIAAQTEFLTGKTGEGAASTLGPGIIPTYSGAVEGAKNIYNKSAGGVLTAAQNLAGQAGQAQQSLGETGESALRTGITGLQSLFDPNYEANQIRNALQPAQAQYQQNLAGQQAAFGGSGNLGSARQALAGQQLAGSNQALMAKTAADTQATIAAQRMTAANSLANMGASNIGQALGAAGQQVSAAMTPQDFYNKYAGVIFGTPSGSYTPDFRGTQGSNSTTTGVKFGAEIPGFGKIGG